MNNINKPKNGPAGLLSLLLATMLYGFFGIYARLINISFDVFTQNWIRATFVISVMLVVFAVFNKKWVKIRKKDLPYIFGWVTCDVLFVISFFVAFNNMPIGTTLFLLYSGITITGYLIGAIFLNEKLTGIKLMAILASFSGLLLVFGG